MMDEHGFIRGVRRELPRFRCELDGGQILLWSKAAIT
jgi:hypothetical protein